jgi:hypothetical protein
MTMIGLNKALYFFLARRFFYDMLSFSSVEYWSTDFFPQFSAHLEPDHLSIFLITIYPKDVLRDQNGNRKHGVALQQLTLNEPQLKAETFSRRTGPVKPLKDNPG